MKEIYTDGSCAKNGAGGWAWISLIDGDLQGGAKGGSFGVTNNKMELQAAIKALILNADKELSIYSDSMYVINGITKWIVGWKKRGWKTKANKDVKNREYWVKLDSLVEGRDITWTHVKAHNGDKWNEAVDKLAREEMESRK